MNQSPETPETPEMSERNITVGLLYPPAIHDSAADYERAQRDWAAVHPGVKVVALPYVEPAEIRTRRATPGYVPAKRDVVPLAGDLGDLLAEAEVLVALDLPFGVTDIAPNLRWVQAIGTGIEQLRSAGLPNDRVQLTNAAGTAANEIAEFVLGRVLEHHKRFADLAAAQRAHEWRVLYGSNLRGKTIGLAGLGAINLTVARLAKAFGMDVVGMRRTAGDPPANVDEVFAPDRFAEMLGRCDVVVAALPGTAETERLFDAAAFDAMPDGSFFVNVGRGSSVDESALCDALVTGQLAGAAIDVANSEPLPLDDPLWVAPHLRISAHCSSVPSLSIVAVNDLGQDNLARYLAGRPLLNVVQAG